MPPVIPSRLATMYFLPQWILCPSANTSECRCLQNLIKYKTLFSFAIKQRRLTFHTTYKHTSVQQKCQTISKRENIRPPGPEQCIMPVVFLGKFTFPLHWRHNGRGSVSNHQPHDFYSTVYPGKHQRKHQSSASLAFVWGIHRGPVNSPHKWPVTRKMFPFDDIIVSKTPADDIEQLRRT